MQLFVSYKALVLIPYPVLGGGEGELDDLLLLLFNLAKHFVDKLEHDWRFCLQPNLDSASALRIKELVFERDANILQKSESDLACLRACLTKL